MKCPKCGYERQPGDHVYVPGTECPACGVVYSKFDSDGQETWEGSGDKAPGTFKKPSPVHEDSLKQARERVEKRLRAKSATHLPDDRRQQIMERAKLFVSEGVRKRQAEWLQKKTMNASGNGDDDDAVEMQAQTEELMVLENKQGEQPAAFDADAAFQPETDNGQSPATQPSPLGEERHGQHTEAFTMSTEEAVESMDQSQAADSAMMADALSRQGRPNGLIRLLPTVAWLILLAGLVGAFLSWTTLGSVYAGPAVSPTPSGGGHIPVALLLGFAYLAIGVLGFAFFWVSSMINGQLREIRQLLVYSSTDDDQFNEMH